MKKTINYTWQDFDHDISVLARNIFISNWTPDVVVGIKRGGLIPAVKLSHWFEVPLKTITYQLRDGEDTQMNFWDMTILPKDTQILLVDDICDSGATLDHLYNHLTNEMNYSNIKTAVLWHNISQKFDCDYCAREFSREDDPRWIIFPWEY